MIDLVISQGPLNHYKEIEKSWENVAPVLHSCWDSDSCARNGLILRSNPPALSGPQNVFMQQKTTLAGVYWAKQNGYKNVLKIRSDMVPTNALEFVKLHKKDLSFLYGHKFSGGYLLDYLMFGHVDDLISLWEFERVPAFPEEAITINFMEKGLYRKDIGFIGRELTQENDLYWIKNNIYISSYQKDELYVPNK